ncbi:MAG: glycine betaine ABC transporter substrate-binding protein [Desulfosalsimonadaceae bacterium]
MKKNALIIIVLLASLLPMIGLRGIATAEKAAGLACGNWASAAAQANIAKAVLQEKMGYRVELKTLSAAAMWEAAANGDIDGFLCAWLPTPHSSYYKKQKENVVNLGINLEGVRIGLVVPAYVTIDSISELDVHAEKFNGEIIGIDAGAGIMEATEKALEEYGIENLKLMDGSGSMMTAVLQEKVENRQWVVVTGWTPHWKFHRFDLKYLEDPKNVYGDTEYIKTIVRKGLKSDKPELYAFLDNFYLNLEDIQNVMDRIRKSGKPYESALRWVKENPQQAEALIPR